MTAWDGTSKKHSAQNQKENKKLQAGAVKAALVTNEGDDNMKEKRLAQYELIEKVMNSNLKKDLKVYAIEMFLKGWWDEQEVMQLLND